MSNVLKAINYNDVLAIDGVKDIFTPPSEPLRRVKAINLFACGGTCCYHLDKISVDVVLANELLPDRAAFHRAIYPKCTMIEGNIMNDNIFNALVKLSINMNVELILSSPKCQQFTVMNQHKDQTNKDLMEEMLLFERVLEFAEKSHIKNVVIENAAEFKDFRFDDKSIIGDQTIGEYITKKLISFGYKVNIDVQNAQFFGIAQSRNRTLVVATREKSEWLLPQPITPVPFTLEQVIDDLESLESGQNGKHHLHYAPTLPKCQIDFLRHTPTGCRAKDNPNPYKPCGVCGHEVAKHLNRYTRKHKDRPTGALLTGGGNIGGDRTVHYGRLQADGTYSNSRCLSILEAARCFGLPDNWPVPPRYRPKYAFLWEILGEAFSPLHLAAILKNMPR